ncbi:MAG: aspartate aminotransferase family protein [Acidimicrobiia bacterium]
MSGVLHRTLNPIVAVRGEGCWIEDAAGKRYLDAAGGAVAVSIGHGDAEVAAAMAEQARRLAYVHAGTFTTEVLERYADEVVAVGPLPGGRVFPVSGGSEAIESALKLVRAYHLARGEPGRTVVLARHGSYHGNTLGALDLSGRPSLRAPYEPWLGRFEHLPEVWEMRCPNPRHPSDCGRWHADRLDEAIGRAGPGRVAALVVEPVGGATLGASIPPDGYWPALTEVCRRHGILLVADEVMTGFGRTGRWFAVDHWQVVPDVLVSAKGASGGYWPLGLVVASREVADAVAGSFVHGFTWSHHAVGAAVGRAVLRRIRDDGLVDRAIAAGARLLAGLRATLGPGEMVGDVRGLGLLVAVELVADPVTLRPYPRSRRVTERVTAAARDHGLLVYPSTGSARELDGDRVLLGPPLTIDDREIDLAVERLGQAVRVAMASIGP